MDAHTVQLLDRYKPIERLITLEDTFISWPFFLTLLEEYCCARGWAVEYKSPTDLSCAIFAHKAVANQQLPLFPNCLEFYAPTYKHTNDEIKDDGRISERK